MTGPRTGSRPWRLAQPVSGESMLLEVPAGKTLAAFMSNLGVDSRRAGIVATQSHILGIEGRRLVDIVRVTRNT